MSTTAFWLAEDYTCEDDSNIFAPASLKKLSSPAQEEFWCTLALRHCTGIGARSQARLLKSFGSAKTACENFRQWPDLGINPIKAQQFERESWRKTAETEWRKSLKTEATIILWKSASYPRLLRELPDTPALLYAAGDLNLLTAPCIAIVGSRNPTPNGRTIAESFGYALSANGITVVSGMAMGIDRQAHLGALRQVGKSIGILGTGIDLIYPKCNADIFAQMRKSALLLSEFPTGSPPAAANFPIRNRIISGLSLGVIVVEAAAKSGSLVTARLALEQNREVFAIPGPALDSHSIGCQNLVRQGARAVFYPDDIMRDMADILRQYSLNSSTHPKPQTAVVTQPSLMPPTLHTQTPELAMPASTQRSTPDVTTSETSHATTKAAQNLIDGDTSSLILRALQQSGPIQADVLAANNGINVSQLNVVLLGLEMAGKIKRLPGARYEIAK